VTRWCSSPEIDEVKTADEYELFAKLWRYLEAPDSLMVVDLKTRADT